jgi:hypothetical protein
MESVLALIYSAENMRMLVLLVFGFSCFVWLKMSFEKRIGGVEVSLGNRIDDLKHNDLAAIGKRIDDMKHNDLAAISKRIDDVEFSLGKRIDDMKYNDFAHLNNTIEALTFTLEKNGYLKREDKEYIDSRLD